MPTTRQLVPKKNGKKESARACMLTFLGRNGPAQILLLNANEVEMVPALFASPRSCDMMSVGTGGGVYLPPREASKQPRQARLTTLFLSRKSYSFRDSRAHHNSSSLLSCGTVT